MQTNTNNSSTRSVAEVFFNFNNHHEIKSIRMKQAFNKSASCKTLSTDSSRIEERRKILDSLRRQQNEHLLGVLEEEQEREAVRGAIIRKLMDEDDRVIFLYYRNYLRLFQRMSFVH